LVWSLGCLIHTTHCLRVTSFTDSGILQATLVFPHCQACSSALKGRTMRAVKPKGLPLPSPGLLDSPFALRPRPDSQSYSHAWSHSKPPKFHLRFLKRCASHQVVALPVRTTRFLSLRSSKTLVLTPPPLRNPLPIGLPSSSYHLTHAMGVPSSPYLSVRA
jgi:hypothetical protein